MAAPSSSSRNDVSTQDSAAAGGSPAATASSSSSSIAAPPALFQNGGHPEQLLVLAPVPDDLHAHGESAGRCRNGHDRVTAQGEGAGVPEQLLPDVRLADRRSHDAGVGDQH